MHRNTLESSITIKDKNSVICLRNIDQDGVGGYLKFNVDPKITSMNEIEKIANLFFIKFENSILLKGLTLKKLKMGEPKCLNCQGRTFRVSSSRTFRYKIEGESRTIQKNEKYQFEKFFNELETNPHLLEMVNDVKDQSKIRKEVGSFVWYWVLFNRIYNPKQVRGKEWDQIETFLNGLSTPKIDSLFTRNNILFSLLSQSNIFRTTRKGLKVNISKELETLLPTGKKREIVKKSIDCVYQIRNILFHYGILDFKDLPRLTNFVFDLVYLNQITQYGKNTLTSFYDIQ